MSQQNVDAIACIRRETINASLCYMLDIEYEAKGNSVGASEAKAVLKGLLEELKLPPITQEEVKDYIKSNHYIQDMLEEYGKTVDSILRNGILNKVWVA